MSEQPQRQLTPEERDYVKAKTRSTNLLSWFAGLSIGGMVLAVGAGLLMLCFIVGTCGVFLYIISLMGTR